MHKRERTLKTRSTNYELAGHVPAVSLLLQGASGHANKRAARSHEEEKEAAVVFLLR